MIQMINETLDFILDIGAWILLGAYWSDMILGHPLDKWIVKRRLSKKNLIAEGQTIYKDVEDER
jgi:hypothetical protein